ncbi:uncharacterized protein LOC101847182 [Aplysia californica]|uniref:Uncharacterized protein LOC101847182 n=1 Tax=Aplysia californica TaxID=6500 RepID=A0ABM0ZXQ5_APLCA|nr:uncharacterized protein LOC101847182 [Aplysia californica]
MNGAWSPSHTPSTTCHTDPAHSPSHTNDTVYHTAHTPDTVCHPTACHTDPFRGKPPSPSLAQSSQACRETNNKPSTQRTDSNSIVGTGTNVFKENSPQGYPASLRVSPQSSLCAQTNPQLLSLNQGAKVCSDEDKGILLGGGGVCSDTRKSDVFGEGQVCSDTHKDDVFGRSGVCSDTDKSGVFAGNEVCSDIDKSGVFAGSEVCSDTDKSILFGRHGSTAELRSQTYLASVPLSSQTFEVGCDTNSFSHNLSDSALAGSRNSCMDSWEEGVATRQGCDPSTRAVASYYARCPFDSDSYHDDDDNYNHNSKSNNNHNNNDDDDDDVDESENGHPSLLSRSSVCGVYDNCDDRNDTGLSRHIDARAVGLPPAPAAPTAASTSKATATQQTTTATATATATATVGEAGTHHLTHQAESHPSPSGLFGDQRSGDFPNIYTSQARALESFRGFDTEEFDNEGKKLSVPSSSSSSSSSPGTPHLDKVPCETSDGFDCSSVCSCNGRSVELHHRRTSSSLETRERGVWESEQQLRPLPGSRPPAYERQGRDRVCGKGGNTSNIEDLRDMPEFQALVGNAPKPFSFEMDDPWTPEAPTHQLSASAGYPEGAHGSTRNSRTLTSAETRGGTQPSTFPGPSRVPEQLTGREASSNPDVVARPGAKTKNDPVTPNGATQNHDDLPYSGAKPNSVTMTSPGVKRNLDPSTSPAAKRNLDPSTSPGEKRNLDPVTSPVRVAPPGGADASASGLDEEEGREEQARRPLGPEAGQRQMAPPAGRQPYLAIHDQEYGRQCYSAYLCVAPGDLTDFGIPFHRLLEHTLGFRVFLPERDFLAGGFAYEELSRVVEERCRGKIIVVLSKNYHTSGECRFLTYFARNLDPDARKRSIVPVKIDKNMEPIPNVLRGITIVHYNHAFRCGWLNEKLRDAIRA